MSEIALVDCNNFYASCEQLMNPALIGKPVCVMSNNDGCVVARSQEAKALGIKMGMPVFMARKEFPQAIYISGNLGLYGAISSRIMSILSQFTPVVEVYSIDEAFLDLSGLKRLYRSSYEEMAVNIRKTVMDEVGIPISIGISRTKTLAKAASEKAKKQSGVYQIAHREIKNELKTINAIEVWGIGSNTASFLAKYGIKTAYQFTLQDNNWIKVNLGKKGLELKEELLGCSVYPVLTKTELPKSIQKTSSFAKFTDDYGYIKNSLNYHTHRACRKLRNLEMKTKVVGLMLRTKDFKVIYDKVALVSPSNCEFEIYKAIDSLLEKLFLPNIIYRSSGVIFENLIQESEEQLSLFNQDTDRVKKEKLTKIWDKLESRFGRNIIITGFLPETPA